MRIELDEAEAAARRTYAREEGGHELGVVLRRAVTQVDGGPRRRRSADAGVVARPFEAVGPALCARTLGRRGITAAEASASRRLCLGPLLRIGPTASRGRRRLLVHLDIRHLPDLVGRGSAAGGGAHVGKRLRGFYHPWGASRFRPGANDRSLRQTPRSISLKSSQRGTKPSQSVSCGRPGPLRLKGRRSRGAVEPPTTLARGPRALHEGAMTAAAGTMRACTT